MHNYVYFDGSDELGTTFRGVITPNTNGEPMNIIHKQSSPLQLSFIPEHGDVGVTFFDCLRCLVEALLPELSEELLQVLSKRVLLPPPTEASLFTPEALEDCFDKEDAEHTHKYLERSAEPVQKEYQRQYVKFRQAHLERQSQTQRKRKRRRGPAAGAEAAAAVAPDSTHSLCPL